MRFLNSLTAAIAVAIILFATSVTLGVVYENLVLKPEPGDLAFLTYYLFSLGIVLIITIILIIAFHVYHEKLNVPIILFSGVFSLWLSELIRVFLPFNFMQYTIILPIIFFILGYVLIKRKHAWLYINGFTLGTIFGLFSSYGAVILWRKIDNTLTSFFWFDEREKTLLLIATFLGAWIGNKSDKKREIS